MNRNVLRGRDAFHGVSDPAKGQEDRSRGMRPHQVRGAASRKRSGTSFSGITQGLSSNRILSVAVALLGFALPWPAFSATGFRPRLNAVKLSSLQVHPGDTIRVAYEFANVGTTAADEELKVFVHVRPSAPGDPDVPPSTGGDFQPLTPTFAWEPDTAIEERNGAIHIPGDFPPGQYRVFLGMYQPGEGHRIEMANADLAAGGSRYRVAAIEVVAKDKPILTRPFEARWHTSGPLVRETKGSGASEPSIWVSGADSKIRLSALRPAVLAYEWADGRALPGDSVGFPVRARICHAPSGAYRTVVLRDASCFGLRQSRDEARYTAQVRFEGRLAASFEVVFRASGNVYRVGIEGVREEPGFLLMDVCLSQLVSAAGPGGGLVVPTQSGRFVRLERSAPGRHVIGMNWFEADLCGAVVGQGLAAAIRTRDWDNELEARVSGSSNHLAGGFSARFLLRADASAKAARMRLAEAPAVEVCLLGKSELGPGPGWVDAAQWLRRDVHGTPNPIYRDAFIYKIYCDDPGAADFTTFDDALEIIRKVHQLAPWVKQVAYLVGWQYRGHDTGYPATDRINARLGGIEGLRRAVAEAARCNAILSYHDNFDDAYRDSPQWDASVIARDTQGECQKGGVWAGGQSYILAFKKYAQKAGLDRVRRTLAQMPVSGSYHIDVLSAVPLRRDYNLAAPENSQASLEGKFAIIREFNRHGVDVTSEGFTAPFVGRIGHAWQLWRRDDSVFEGDEAIPFIPMIYHGGPTTYSRGRSSATYARDSALYGAGFSEDWTKKTSAHSMAEAIYLVGAPWASLRDRKMRDYQKRGGLARVTYSADTFVEANESNSDWRVVVDGVPVVENDLVVVRKEDVVAVYSQRARRASVSLPTSWQGRTLAVTNGCTLRDLAGQAKVSGGTVELELPAREPVLIRAGR